MWDVYRPDDPGAALLRVNMVVSADGAATDERGHSEGLGGDGDGEVFRTLRAQADAILVGAGTVRAEGYGPYRLRADLAERREGEGRSRAAPIIVVTRSLDLDLDAPLFTEARTPTIVLTCAAAPEERRHAAARVGRVLVVGNDDVELPAALAELRTELGLAHLLCEGGPTLNAPLFQSSLVDELCLTVAPRLIGGTGPHLIRGLGGLADLGLLSLCEHDGELLARYRLPRHT